VSVDVSVEPYKDVSRAWCDNLLLTARGLIYRSAIVAESAPRVHKPTRRSPDDFLVCG
jgi:hypothetical protein